MGIDEFIARGRDLLGVPSGGYTDIEISEWFESEATPEQRAWAEAKYAEIQAGKESDEEAIKSAMGGSESTAWGTQEWMSPMSDETPSPPPADAPTEWLPTTERPQEPWGAPPSAQLPQKKSMAKSILLGLGLAAVVIGGSVLIFGGKKKKKRGRKR